jgi:ABC-type cobalamin/Fe3+-siderophores transport system ATPase subunit
MIVVGYQGIGKSSMAKNNADVIDLESGNFWVDGKRIDDWYKIYANIAKHLSDQGKIVFTSSHKVFRDYLNEKGIEFTVVFPSQSS